MTEADWKNVEEELSFPFGRVKLLIDGYTVDVVVSQEKENSLKFVLAVYVNGSIKGEWLMNDCEIRRKFYCKHTRSFISAKDKKSPAFKRMKKADREEIIKSSQYDWYAPYFTSVRAFKSHITKNNDSIELIEK